VGLLLTGDHAPQADEPAAPAQEEGTTQMVHTVTFYNNGFTVDDGPLRQQEDPANAPFLASIEKVRAACVSLSNPPPPSARLYARLSMRAPQRRASPAAPDNNAITTCADRDARALSVELGGIPTRLLSRPYVYLNPYTSA
jgi:hypothetical protein